MHEIFTEGNIADFFDFSFTSVAPDPVHLPRTGVGAGAVVGQFRIGVGPWHTGCAIASGVGSSPVAHSLVRPTLAAELLEGHLLREDVTDHLLPVWKGRSGGLGE